MFSESQEEVQGVFLVVFESKITESSRMALALTGFVKRETEGVRKRKNKKKKVCVEYLKPKQL